MTNIDDYKDNNFLFKIAQDLSRVDGVFTTLIKDSNKWNDFFNDPNGTLIQLGLHPPASKDANEIANKVFYASLSNKEVISLVHDLYKDFQPTEQQLTSADNALKRGVIENPLDLDIAAVNHFFRDEEKARKIYQVALFDLNNRNLFKKKYSEEEINQYIDTMIKSVQEGKSLGEIPTL